MNMTRGSIIKTLILFALPILLSSVIQQMYNTVDLLFVGNILGKEAAAAVGASSMIITCIIGFFSGISVGTNVILAKIFGSKNKNEFKSATCTAISIALIAGSILTLIGIAGSKVLLSLINTPNAIIEPAIQYIKIYFLSITSMLVYNMGSGIIRASGNSHIPMIVQFIGGLINIASNTVFIVILGLGIKGAAWATFFSQITAAILVLLYIIKDKKNYNVKLKELKIDKNILFQISIIGIPAGIQTLVISLSNIVAQSYINSLDVDSIAAFTAYFKIELLLYYPILAVGQAIMTFTGQNIGAGKVARVIKGTNICIVFGIVLTMVNSKMLLLSGDIWFRLFNSDTIVITRGIEIISITFPFYFMYVILEVLSAVIRGSGKSIGPMIIIIFNICLLRVALLYIIVPLMENVKGVAITYPITWLSTAMCMVVLYVYQIRNIRKSDLDRK